MHEYGVPTVFSAIATPHVPVGPSSDFEIGPNNIRCGHGKGSYNHPGNKKFRALVQEHVSNQTLTQNAEKKFVDFDQPLRHPISCGL